MGKRGADRQITDRDDPDALEAEALDDGGLGGPPLKADAETLSKRKIITGRRKFGTGAAAAAETTEGKKEKSGMFTGLKLNAAVPNAGAVKGRPAFGTPMPGASIEFGAKSPQTKSTFGSKAAGTPTFGGFKKPDPKTSSFGTPSKSPAATAGIGTKASSPAATAANDSGTIASEFNALNSAFLATITDQASGKDGVVMDLTSCCNEYIAFAKQITSRPRPASALPKKGNVVFPTTAAKVDAAEVVETVKPEDAKGTLIEDEDDDDDALYTLPKVRVLYLKHFDKSKKEGEPGRDVYAQHKLKELKEAGNDEAKWTPRGVGKLLITEIDGKRALAVRSQESSDKMYLVNVMLSNIKPTKQGKKNVLFVALPNPPHGEKCPVCAAKYEDMRSNQCVNGCSGPDGFKLTTPTPPSSDYVPEDGTKEAPQPYSLKVSSSDVADALIAKINEFKE